MLAQNRTSAHPRVLCVSSYFLEHGGGVENIAHEIARHFADVMQWPTTLVAHTTGEPPHTSDTGYKRFALQCWNGIEAATGLPVIIPNPLHVFRLLRPLRDYDLVMVHEEIYVSNFLVIIWSVLTRTPLVVVKHTGIVPLKNHPVLRWLLLGVTRWISRPLLRRAAHTVFVTRAKRDNYDPDHSLKNALVIPNGIDTDCFHLPEPGAPPRAGIVFVGRFVESKGLALLRHLTAALPDIPFTLIGWGPENPKDWRHKNTTVILKPARATIAKILRRSRLALVPSNGEGIPLVAMEALSCGTATMLGTGSNGTENRVASQLVYVPADLTQPAQAAALWADRIRDILSTSDTPEAEAARHDAVEAGHSRTAMCRAYVKIAQDALQAQKSVQDSE